MCDFENIRYELCSDEVEKKVQPCENYRRRLQDKFCRNTVANTSIENKHELCPRCVDEGCHPAATTVPDRGDYSKIRIIERVDFVYKYEEHHPSHYDGVVFTSEGIAHRQPVDAWARNLVDFDDEFYLPEYLEAVGKEQSKASASKTETKATREESPDPLSQSWVTHAGSPEDSPWELMDSDLENPAIPAHEPSGMKKGKYKVKRSVKEASSRRR